MSAKNRFYALLIGINHYLNPKISTLSGCINDVYAFTGLLQDKFQIPQENLKQLLDDDATHANIKTVFRQHLIDNAKVWVEAGKPEPAPTFLFLFCGHGSRAPDATKPGGMDETIVPYDSRQGGVFDIKDWELSTLINELAEWGGDNITVILDCCHSGSGTREMENSKREPGVRFYPPDTRPQPYANPNPQPVTRGIVKQQQNHVLLAACLNTEKAYEYTVVGDEVYKQGVMSYFLVSTLSQIDSNQTLTYSELHRTIAEKVKQLYRNQTPQCEGDTKREIFGGLRPAYDNFLYVTGKEGAYVLINGGRAHGLENGAVLHVYSPNMRTLKEAGEPLAVLSLQQAGGMQSRCVMQTGDAEAIEIHAVVIVVRHSKRRLLYVDIQDTHLRAQLEKSLTEFELAACLEVVRTPDSAEFIVRKNNDNLALYHATGKQLCVDTRSHDYALLLNALHITRYFNALELQNLEPSAPLQGKLSIQIISTNALSSTDNGVLIIPENQSFTVEIINQSDKPLYFALFAFSDDWSMELVYPEIKNTQEYLEPHKTFHHNFSYEIDEIDKDTVQVTAKVIACTEPANFEWLEQGKLGTHYVHRGANEATGLNALLQEVMLGRGRGRMRIDPPRSGTENWITAQVDYQVVRSESKL